MAIDTYSLATQGQNSFSAYVIAVMGYNQLPIITDVEENVLSVLKTKKTMSYISAKSKNSYLYMLNSSGKRVVKKASCKTVGTKSSVFTKMLYSNLVTIKKEN